MSQIVLYDPSAPAENETQLERRAIDGLAGKTIGVIDNAKPNFNHLAAELGALLVSKYGVRSVVTHQKRNASIPAGAEVVANMARQCDLVIAGSGD